ncbi:hypothetical protein ABVL59_004531 [Salmonella enterica]|nr:hypothetical protein [Salmonella enterica]EEP5062920.1 hypothetical protein [Salmonella enterica]EGC1620351.1 hypothetical protein [Salmonella enterica]EGG2542940.1 hypothetical protein [Salmonella enterica]EGP9152641.1 hypothetical protein [Salmonella enterica]
MHFTLASTAARLRWMHGTARHNTEAAAWKTTRRRPAGLSRVNAEPERRHHFCLSSPASSQSPAEKLKKEKGFASSSLSRYRLQLIIHRTQLI